MDAVLERTDLLSLPTATGREAYHSYDPFEEYSSALAKVGLRLQKTSVRIEKPVDHVDKLPTDN
jgi:hypothetical protein